MNEEQSAVPVGGEPRPQQEQGESDTGAETPLPAGLETLALDEPLDEDSALDAEDFLDLDEMMNTLRRVHDLLERQNREIQGLRREMRELREGQGARGGQGRSFQGDGRGEYRREFRPRDDRRPYEGGGERREFRPRNDEGYRPRPQRDRDDRFGQGDRFERGGQGGDRFGRSGSRERQEFRPRGREERGFDRDRGERAPRDEGGAFRPRARRDHGWRDDE